jgi:hypothetical protein
LADLEGRRLSLLLRDREGGADGLVLRGPASRKTERLIEGLKSRRQELVAYLKGEAEAARSYEDVVGRAYLAARTAAMPLDPVAWGHPRGVPLPGGGRWASDPNKLFLMLLAECRYLRRLHGPDYARTSDGRIVIRDLDAIALWYVTWREGVRQPAP